MYKIEKHPILDIPQEDLVEFQYEGKTVKGQPLFTDCTYVGQENGLIVCHIDKKAYLCNELKRLSRWDFGVLITRNQYNQIGVPIII